MSKNVPMDKVSKEEMLDETAMAFSTKTLKANKEFPWRVPAIERARDAVLALIEQGENAPDSPEGEGALILAVVADVMYTLKKDFFPDSTAERLVKSLDRIVDILEKPKPDCPADGDEGEK